MGQGVQGGFQNYFNLEADEQGGGRGTTDRPA